MIVSRVKDLFEAEAGSFGDTMMAHNGVAGYKVPEYQRQYNWRRDHLRRLLTDCLNGFNRLSTSRLREGETADMTFNFDGRILTIGFGDRVHEVIASGEDWATSYSATVTAESRFPPRFESPWVELSVFEGYICVDRFRLGPCEAPT